MAEHIERNRWEPQFFQISEQLREKIQNALAPWDNFPSENVMTASCSVSHNPFRQPNDALIEQNLIDHLPIEAVRRGSLHIPSEAK